MFNRKSAAAAFGVALGLVVAAASVHAWNPVPRTQLTFSGAVSLPGVTLAAGTYVFEIANPESSSNIVRVRSKADSRHVYFMAFTYRIDRPATLGAERQIVLGEASAGKAPPILAWFPAGTSTGQQFIYRQ